jgi:hypothetical protein
MNLHNISEKYSDTYNVDFLIDIFFTLSTLGAEAATKVLEGADLSAEGRLPRCGTQRTSR